MMSYARLERIAPVVVMGVGLLMGPPNMIHSSHYKIDGYFKRDVSIAGGYDAKVFTTTEEENGIGIGHFDKTGKLYGDQLLTARWKRDSENCEFVELYDVSKDKWKRVSIDKQDKGLVALASCDKLKEIARNL